MNDTSAAVDARFRQMMLARSPGERLAMACRMFATARTLVRSALLREHGPLDRLQLRRLTFERLYGRDFTDTEREKILRHLTAVWDNELRIISARRRTPPL